MSTIVLCSPPPKGGKSKGVLLYYYILNKQAYNTLRGLEGYITRIKYTLKKYLTAISKS
jgi:hypothetical protein